MIRKIFDSNNSSGWLIMAFVVLAVGLLFSFFTPVFIALVRFQTDTKIGFSPNEATIWYQL